MDLQPSIHQTNTPISVITCLLEVLPRWGYSPIPKSEREEIKRAALGFLRSYFYLVRHKSDFILAADDKHRLVPKHISYSDFMNFVLAFDKVEDISVAPRYNFGELRLTRLNFWSKIFLRRFTYQKIHHQYGAHFAQFYAPLLFIFGVFSVALNAMQVVLAYPTFTSLGQSWVIFANTSRDFSICTLVCVVLVALLLIGTMSAMFLREIIFALGDLYCKRMSKSRESFSTPKSIA
jgi:multidrug transporter EmrE-like cation transporter